MASSFAFTTITSSTVPGSGSISARTRRTRPRPWSGPLLGDVRTRITPTRFWMSPPTAVAVAVAATATAPVRAPVQVPGAALVGVLAPVPVLWRGAQTWTKRQWQSRIGTRTRNGVPSAQTSLSLHLSSDRRLSSRTPDQTRPGIAVARRRARGSGTGLVPWCGPGGRRSRSRVGSRRPIAPFESSLNHRVGQAKCTNSDRLAMISDLVDIDTRRGRA